MNKQKAKKCLLAVVILGLLLATCGCGMQHSSAENNRLVGKWYSGNMYQSRGLYLYMNSWRYYIYMLEFYENGKCIVATNNGSSGTDTFVGSYVICDDETLIIYTTKDAAFKFELSGDTLSLWTYTAQIYKDLDGDEPTVTQYTRMK